MTSKKLLINIFEKVIKIYSFFVLYSSIIWIVLSPMLFLIGGFFAFLNHFYGISWFLADPTIFNPHHINLMTCWLNSSLINSFFYSNIWIILMFIIFGISLFFFIISLGNLVIGIRNRAGLVQEGIYKYIRHPQNLAIIIMAFPLFLVNGFPINLVGGFRLGDLVTWIQFIFLMIIYSDFGDMKLRKKYPQEFQSYYEKTGFFFPRILPYRFSCYFSAIYNKKFRYPLLILVYILCILILYQLFLVLPFTWITM